jgi:hypothetical protein
MGQTNGNYDSKRGLTADNAIFKPKLGIGYIGLFDK